MSFIPVAEDSDFPIQNLPYGVFSTQSNVSIEFWAREPGGGSSGRFLQSLGGERLWLQCRSAPIAVHDTEIQYMWVYVGLCKNQSLEKWELSLLPGQQAFAIVTPKRMHNFAGHVLTKRGWSFTSMLSP